MKEIQIPEGYEARIEGNKVILEPKESEDERIRKAIESIIRVYGKTQGEWIAGYDMDTLVVHLRDAFAHLERQKEQKPAEWSEEDEKMLKKVICVIEDYQVNDAYKEEIDWLKSLRQRPKCEIYKSAKHDLAIRFMNYLDENRPNGKMSLSNGEGEDIDKAFIENDWAKILRYVEKYSPSWKPSKEQMG